MSAAAPSERLPAAGAKAGGVAEWRFGWPLVVASLLGVSVSGLHVYSAGLFMEPLEQEFGWSRAVSSSGLAVVSIVAIVFTPFVGALVDRLGARRMGVAGVLLYCLSFALLSTTSSAVFHWWALWALFAFFAVTVKPTVWTVAIASRFDASRGLALSVILCGAALTSMTAPIVANYLIGHHGWRFAYVSLAVIWGLVALPWLFACFFDATDLDARNKKSGQPKRAAVPLAEFIHILRSKSFVQLAAAGALINIVLVAMAVHFVPIAVEHGIDRVTAATFAGLIGGAQLVGRLFTGFVLDRVNAAFVGAVAFVLPAVAALLIFYGGSTWHIAIAAIILGLGYGAEIDVIAYLATRHFGRRGFGTVFGVIVALLAATTGLGSQMAGLIHDQMGSYSLLLIGVLPLCGMSAVLICGLRRYSRHGANAVAD